MKFPFNVIDLTQTLTTNSPSWALGCGFNHETTLSYDECTTEVKFKVQQLAMPAGIGTHIDTPAHCIKNGLAAAELDLIKHHLITQCVVIDVSLNAHERYIITPQDILTFEAQHGEIPPHTFVIFYTGWEQYWDDAEKYRNHLIFPCLGEQAALLLLERTIAGIGIDTLSPDRPENGYAVHQLLFQHQKYIVENIANATKLPPSGAYTLVLPMKISGLTEAPVRIIALCP